MEITRDGIVFALDNAGRQTGEAYIKFASVSTADKALSKHKERIGHRLVQVETKIQVDAIALIKCL